MSDNQDLKSKILLMRQKNFGEVINESNEKNDNEKPENNEIKKDEVLTEHKENKVSLNNNNLENKIQLDTNSEISELKENLNKVAETNEKAFDLLAKKFNESVEVILELTQRVEKLETVTKLQSMQESVNKNEVKPSQKGLKFFLFLLFVAGISYFFYKFDIDLSILKDISRDFLAILGK
ncbi:MAG: hypothetical protein EVA21_02980 [Alphaproteobacteria bacterium]|nr:MAG: hypothetical protein EVA21_02980 [Alphaproteobacteria bacterium]